MPQKLPKGWVQATLGAVCAINPRRRTEEARPDHTEVSFVPMAAVEEESGRLDASQTRPLASVRRGYTPFEENDVVFAKITPCMENGKIALATGLKNGLAYGSTEFLVFRAFKGVLPRFVLHFLLQQSLRQNAEHQMTGAVGQKRVPVEYLSRYEFPLPPTSEQERIVVKLDASLSAAERAELATQRALDRLRRYRVSVLKAAVSGQLTREWRRDSQKNKRGNETGEVLLRKIQDTRRSRWEEAERERLRAKGKVPADDRWKNRYSEPALPKTTDLVDLPNTWTWASLESVAEIGSGISVSQNRVFRNAIELPYLRVANVLRGRLDLSEVKNIRVEKDQAASYLLRSGDILFTEGGDRDKLGRGWIWEDQLSRCVHQNHVFRARPIDPSLLNPKFVSHWGNTFGQLFFLKHAKQTTNLASINRGVLAAMPLPIPPVEEQFEILRELGQRLDAASKLETKLQQQLTRSRLMREALRGQAFTGQLGTQSADDVPAAVLFEVIRAALDPEPKRGNRVKKSSLKATSTETRELLTVLGENGRPMTPEELFQASGHSQESVDDFFAKLRDLTEAPPKITEERQAGRVTLAKV